MKIFWTVSKLSCGDDIYKKKSKGHNSVKVYVDSRFLFFTLCLMMVYICTKFHENILNCIRVMERTQKDNGRTDGQTDGRTDGGHDIIRPADDRRINIVAQYS